MNAMMLIILNNVLKYFHFRILFCSVLKVLYFLYYLYKTLFNEKKVFQTAKLMSTVLKK